jgi:hypothetical protein
MQLSNSIPPPGKRNVVLKSFVVPFRSSCSRRHGSNISGCLSSFFMNIILGQEEAFTLSVLPNFS